ncbi:hypothetical protein [Catenuloplanes atrovinosus]|uniref:Zn-binding protein involved in type VI secretion n=1 Tax=Catenuloplanes atrovinosus TaxID=137266 RepID=A0AAE3YNT6_9ACTN|nr:hypothetical protein [Catenuloplanes atrovinosus]MDR7275499.1 putative Zn-binding protein involved in type VI secretion [Catenuloplanes atrovinosus]
MSRNAQHVNETLTCPHGGRASIAPGRSRVLVNGNPVATLADRYTVIGCPFTAGNKPQPCVTITWTTAAERVRAQGSPVLPQGATGLCQSAERIPAGPPQISVIQQRVVAR